MKKFLSLILIFCLIFQLLCLAGCKAEKSKYTDYSFDYFDTVTTIIGYENSEEEFDKNCEKIKAQLYEYHKLYTIYTSYEGINNLCKLNAVASGQHSKLSVDSRIIDLIEFGKEVYLLTNEKVNIAMGSVLSIWHDYREEGLNYPEKARLPDMEDLKKAAEHTDIRDVIIDTSDNTVYLNDPEMSLDVGAVAKGYAVEQTALFMEEQGIDGYILNVGGNVRAVGNRNGENWKIGIENPDTENEEEPYIAYIEFSDMSLVTSGSYQRYYTVDGKNYHHIIDPDTLMPAEYFLSVSVLCKNSGFADALSTALFSMSYEEGKALIESLDNTEAMWVLPDGTQKFSSGFEAFCQSI